MVNNNYKVDLHTHSIISHDGGISKKQYIKLLDNGTIDCIAITDHNETSFAKALNDELGLKIIVGEEISTTDGEITGLFLTKTIPAGLSAKETVAQIKNDGGLVYIPHPFETLRNGLQEDVLSSIIKDVDIIEVFNGRGIIKGKPDLAFTLAKSNNLPGAASSDAHCKMGVGVTFTAVKQLPDRESLLKLLIEGELQKKHAPIISLLCPSVNRIKNKFVLGV